jgi:APA family basic amino acid/polyamine antiporter
MIGPAGGAFIAVAVLVSTFGCVNGLTLAGARVVYAMSRDGLFFHGAGRVHPRHRTPATALLLHGAVAGVLTLTGTYSNLLTMTAFSSLLFNVLTVVGLFVLRRRRPDLPRPYRVWGYPVVPLLFVVVAVFFLVYIPVANPRYTGLGLLLTAAGIPAYLYWRRHR